VSSTGGAATTGCCALGLNPLNGTTCGVSISPQHYQDERLYVKSASDQAFLFFVIHDRSAQRSVDVDATVPDSPNRM